LDEGSGSLASARFPLSTPPWLLFECKIEEIEGYFVLCRWSREFAVPFSPRAVVPLTHLLNGLRTGSIRVRSIS
jgi:hypothetical protein